MCESMYIYTCTSELHMYQFSGNLNRFFDLISTYSLSKLPNLNNYCINVNIHILEFHNLPMKYMAFTA